MATANRWLGRNRNAPAQTNYDEGHYAFSHQLPTYAPQNTYGMPPWPQGQQYTQQMYGGYGAFSGGFPNASAGASPMNYGAYYPPGSGYGAPSVFNRGYPAANSYTPTGSSSHSQQATPGATNGKSGIGGGHAGQNNAVKNGNDSALLTSMQSMSLSSK